MANVECVPPDRIKFDFLGKDSMRYENETAVHPQVFSLMQKFSRGELLEGLSLPFPAHTCCLLSSACLGLLGCIMHSVSITP